jgi:transposase
MLPSQTIGVDISSERLVCTYYDSVTDTSLAYKPFKNDPDDIRRLLSETPQDAVFVAEPTGRYGDALVRMATQIGRRVLLAPPRDAKFYLKSMSSRVKNDPVDSAGLARFGCAKELHPYTLKDDCVEQLDQLLSARHLISDSISRLEMQKKSLSYASANLGEAVKGLRAEVKDIEKQIDKLLKSDERFAVVAKMKQIPGVGAVTAAAAGSRLVSKQFKSADSFVAYCGLDVKVSESGKSAGKSVLTKNGDAELRSLFFCCALATLRCKEGPFAETYRHMTQDLKLPATKALCAIARKIAMMCWSIVRYETDYDPARVHAQPARKKLPSDVSHA